MDHFIRLKQLREIVPVSSATIWRWVSEGTLPAPVKLNKRTTAWRASEVEAWIASFECEHEEA